MTTNKAHYSNTEGFKKCEHCSPSYTVMQVLNYESNKGNPDTESENFATLEDAKASYDELLTHKSTESGKTCEISLWKSDEDGAPLGELLESDYQESEKLADESIIVYYKHVTYMNYAYKVLEVESGKGKRYEDLTPNEDYTSATWSEVFDNVKDLQLAYEHGQGIFAKLQSGSSIVEAFLGEQGIEGYIDEETEE